MANQETNIPTIIDNPEALEAKMKAMKEAQKVFATYTKVFEYLKIENLNNDLTLNDLYELKEIKNEDNSNQ